MSRPPRPVILIPAAGASSRMGARDKLLEPVQKGVPLLRRVAERALATKAPVIVTLPPQNSARARVLDGLDLQVIRVARADEGMAASLRDGSALADRLGASGIVILPADMPDLTTADIRAVIDAFVQGDASKIVRATSARGTPGHPVVIPRRLFGELADLTGDEGARSLLAGQPVVRVALPGDHALCDLDTPQDWQAWRAGQTGPADKKT